MADKERIIKEKLEHSGIFDFSGFYSFAHSWFKDENYGVDEEKYVEKVKGEARDIRIEWRATKHLSDYFKIEIEIKFNIRELTDVEAEINGTRKKMNKGNVEVEIKGTLVKDPFSKWDTSAIMRFLRDVYNKFIIPARVESLEYTVSNDVKKFKEEMKIYLELTGRR